jgi:hypothetical protein
MSNIHSLSDLKKKGTGGKGGNQPADYYAGGVSNDGGGSGVAIQLPNDPIASIVQNASAGGPDGAPTSGDIAVELYRNGFIVVNQGVRGPFRSKEDPENHVFLADLRRGQVPRELEQLVGSNVRHFAWRYCWRCFRGSLLLVGVLCKYCCLICIARCAAVHVVRLLGTGVRW